MTRRFARLGVPANRRDPYTRDRPEPIEVLAKLAGRSNYLVPTEGRSTAAPAMTSLDVAHAIASAPEKLGAAMGLAIACQRPNEWGRVHELGYPRLLHELTHQRAFPGVVAGPLRFRARIGLRDAFSYLIAPTQAPPVKRLAASAGIDEHAYRFIYRQATGFLQAAANTAAAQACVYLFAPDRDDAGQGRDGSGMMTCIIGFETGQRQRWRASGAKALADRVAHDLVRASVEGDDVHMLCALILAEDADHTRRARYVGTLSLHGHTGVVVVVNGTPPQ